MPFTPKYYWYMNIKPLSVALGLALLTALPSLAADIYLVRHAEEALDGSEDPDLTEVGTHRVFSRRFLTANQRNCSEKPDD